MSVGVAAGVAVGGICMTTREARWAALIDQRERAFRVARSRAGSGVDPEDLVQEAWARIAAMQHVDLSRIGSLVTTVICNLAVDEVRRDARLHRAAPRLVDRSAHELDDEAVCDRAWARWLDQQIGRLSARDAEVLRLRVDAHTTRAIAAQLGMSCKAAESALDRARRKLRAIAKTSAAVLAILWSPRVRASHSAGVTLAVMASALAIVLLPHSVERAAAPAPASPAAIGRQVSDQGPERGTQSGRDHEQRSSAAAAPPKPSSRPSVLPVAALPAFETPVLAMGSHRVDREHDEESFLETVQRCVEEGLIVEPTHVECRERTVSAGS